MSESAEDRARVVVIPMQPGLVYVKLMDPKPRTDQTESCLRQTINQWFKAHPGFVIDRAETVTDHGQMQGVQVWYHEGATGSEPAISASEPAPTGFSIEVHKSIADRFPKEYIEAVISDAMLILPAYKHRRDTLVVINPPARHHPRRAGEPRSRDPRRADRAGHRGPKAGPAGAMAGCAQVSVLRDAHCRQLV